MKLFTQNLGWKLLALVIAVTLWMVAAREPDVATSISVPIEFKNLPDDLDIGGNLPDRVRLEVRGPSGRLSRDNLADISLVLDLAAAHVGEHTYTISPSNVNLPFGIAFFRSVPSQITLRLDQLVAREVPIRPFFINIPVGYRVTAARVEPSKVQIRGPEERVDRIRDVKTDPVDLTGVLSQKQFQTGVNVGDPQVRLKSPANIRLDVTTAKGSASETPNAP